MGDTVMIEARDSRSFEGYLAVPKGGKGPGLLVLPEMFNVNSAIRQMTDDYAAKGFVALAPDMYWRQQPRAYLEYGRHNSPRGHELYDALDRDLAVEDMGQCAAYLRRHAQGNGKVGIVGFCMGGEIGLLVGCRSEIDALAIYYGTNMTKHLDEMPKLRPPTVMHFPAQDRFIPMSDVEAIKSRVGNLKHVAVYVYEGLEHAFARPNHDKYDAAGTALAWQRTMETFKPLFA